MKKFISIILASALLLVLAAGCQQAEPEPTQPAATEPTQPEQTAPVIENDFAQTGMLAEGQSVTLTADTLSGDIVWSSSNPDRLTVDAAGVVTALADRGTVTVTATGDGGTQSWQIPLCQQTQFGNVSLSCVDKELTVGVWVGAFHWFDETYMQLMADAGINLLIGVKDQWIWEGDGAPMLDLGEQYGVELIADIRGWDGQTVPEYAQHPALRGFLLYDEPCATEFDNLAVAKENFEQVMPQDKLFYVNIFPEGCSYESLFGNDYNPAKVDYKTFYQNRFLDTVEPEILSYDAYALQEGGYIRSSYYHNFDIAAFQARMRNIPFWYTLCTSGHHTTDGRYVTPTDRELRWQMALGMTYGAKALNHYVLSSPTEGDDNMLSFAVWEPTPIYDAVKQTNLEFTAWEDIYLSYNWIGTAQVDAGNVNPMLDSLEYHISLDKAGALTGVKSDQDLLVGVFQNAGGNGYMITNAGTATDSELWQRYELEMVDAQVKLELAEGSYRCAAVIHRGQIQYVPVGEGNTVDLQVPAYDSVFVIPIS